jgi:pyruvate formate lyase activating enzyme
VCSSDLENSVHIIDRQKCIRCGECVPECPTKALSLCGREVDTDDVIKEVLHDKAYYQDEGGMTISGGEPLMQREFTKELISLAKKDAVNVALETNVCYDYSWLDGIRENVDLFLVDWKETDLNKHYEFTKASNEKILSNIQRLHDEDYSVLVRCPIIPGYNDTEEHFNKIADMTKSMPKLLGAEIIPYHNLGILKFERFGLEEELKYITLEQPDTQVVNQWIQYIRDRGGRLVNDSI